MKADLQRLVERHRLGENDEAGDREELKALLLFPKRNRANSIAALRKKLQLNGTNLVLEGRLLAGRTVSHLLCKLDHKR